MDDFDIITTLGHGTGGDVYLVRSKKHKKLLALKKVLLDEKKKTRTKEAVLREANILSALKHPHIVTYYESFFDQGSHLCIVQDYCDGGSLDEKIDTARAGETFLQEHQVMEWFIQIAMAVQYIHSKKILHRDLKTQNVFLTKKGVVKLGDFGIARTLDYTIDKASTCVGTPCYLSPELCQDIPYNNKSDIWALGCLLFEMCGLQPAFDANNLISLFYKIVKCDHLEVPSIYSDDMRNLIDSILVKEPDNRPSASAILAMPFVQKCLTSFIEERQELLQQQKKPSRPHSSEGHCGSGDAGNVSELSMDVTSLDVTANSENLSASSSPVTGRKLAPRDSGEYSDDFTSSDEDDGKDSSEEEIEEVCEVVIDDDIPVIVVHSPRTIVLGNHGLPAVHMEKEIDYADDFEEELVESDPENLDEIITYAKTAVGVDVNDDDDITMEELLERPGSSCRQLLRDHCIESLGKDVFDEVQRKCQQGVSPADFMPQFEHVIGSDHLETCYLVNEILAEENHDKVCMKEDE